MQQASALPNSAPAWQNPQYVSAHSSAGYAAAATMPVQNPWDPTMQGGRPTTFPGQEYASPPVPSYATSAIPPGSSPISQPNTPFGTSHPAHAHQGTPPPGQPR